jgi:hypothetical protein
MDAGTANDFFSLFCVFCSRFLGCGCCAFVSRHVECLFLLRIVFHPDPDPLTDRVTRTEAEATQLRARLESTQQALDTLHSQLRQLQSNCQMETRARVEFETAFRSFFEQVC